MDKTKTSDILLIVLIALVSMVLVMLTSVRKMLDMKDKPVIIESIIPHSDDSYMLFYREDGQLKYKVYKSTLFSEPITHREGE